MFITLRSSLSGLSARQVRRLGHHAYFWLAALISIVVLLDIHYFQRISIMQGRIFDTLMSLRLIKPSPDKDIVILDIDEASLASMGKDFGRWPWPNQVFGELVAGLQVQNPKAIVFDILFSDPDVARPASDTYFNSVIAKSENTWFPMLRLSPHNDALSRIRPHMLPGLVPLPGYVQEDHPVAIVLPHVPAALTNGKLGTHNVDPDVDGVIRQGKRYLPHAGWGIPSLASRVAGTDIAHASPDFLINWRGNPFTYRFVPFVDVYQDLLRKKSMRAPDEFTGKIVLIGSTAPSLFDVKASPLAHIHPGVEMLATMIDNLKNRDYLNTQPRWLTTVVSLSFIWAMAWALSRQIRVTVFDNVFAAAQLGFLGVSWASLNFTHYYLDFSAAVTFGTLYFALARFFVKQSQHWLANSHIYDIQCSNAGSRVLSILTLRYSVRNHAERRRLEGEVSHQVSLSNLGASRIANLVEDPGLIRELFDDTLLVYWLANDSDQEAVNVDCSRIEDALSTRQTLAGGRLACWRLSRPLVWNEPNGWKMPLRRIVLDAVSAADEPV